MGQCEGQYVRAVCGAVCGARCGAVCGAVCERSVRAVCKGSV